MKGYEIFTKEKMVYLYKATKPIGYKKLRDRIYFEISNHIDDMFCDYIDNGMNEENATKKFLDEMGDPEELGKELKKTHSKKLFLIKLRNAAIFLTVFALIISAFGYNESLDNLKLAKQYELPEETVELEKSLITYTDLGYWDFFNDILYYTNIDWHYWSTSTPIYKVKEYNLFNDYYVLDESQSIVVDLAYAMHGTGKIYIDDISKLPENHHSDKLSKAVFLKYDSESETYIEICPDFTENEVTEISKLSDPHSNEPLEIDVLTYDNIPNHKVFPIKFYIKDLEGLFYRTDGYLYKVFNGKYYMGWKDDVLFSEVPEHLAKKIDKAFEDAGMEF